MSAITQSYKIDMTSGAVPLRIKVSQYDAGIRTLTFALFNLGAKLTSAQLSSLTAYVQGTKQDKKGFEYECTADFSAEGCSVTVAITEQMTACAGDVVCELVLVAGDDRIGSANFILEVERAALGADTDISETELPDIITAGRQYAAQAEDAAERAEEAAAGVDNYALAGAGMMTEYSAGVIDTNIYLHREPKIGDRLLIMFTQTFTENTPIKIYKENGGTAYTLNFDMWSTAFVLKGLCLVEVVDFLDNFALRWLHSYSGTDYQAGQYIGINGNYINNIAPQLGDNSEYHEKDSAITDGNLGTYDYYAKYIIINFKARAVPNDTTGKYSLQLSKGATLEDASLVDRDGNDFTAPIKTGVILLCSVDNSNDIVTVLNNDIMANGDIIDGQGNTLSVLAEALTKTASGNPVILTDCAGGKARSLVTTIEPIQDLHGYDHPWAGGAEKNKLPMTVESIKALNTEGTWSGNVYTWRGVSFTLQTDVDDNLIGIKATGAASETMQLYLNTALTHTLLPNAMILNGCPANGGTSTYYMRVQMAVSPWTVLGDDVGSGANVSIPDDNNNYQVIIRVVSGYAIPSGGLLFKPMLHLSTESDATFAPYSNICPISGRTEASAKSEGKNLAFASTGNNTVIANNIKPGTYTFSCKNAGNVGINIKANSQDGATLAYTPSASTTNPIVLTFTVTEKCNIYVNGYGSRYDIYVSDYQIEEGSVATPYEPYAHSSATIQLGTTVYGGEVDFDTGVVTVTDAIVDLGTLNYKYTSGYGGLFYAVVANSKFFGDGSLVGYDCLCSCYKSAGDKTWTNFNNNDINIGSDTAGGGRPCVNIKDTRYTDVASFKTAVTGQTICYKLATPQTIQLTPTQLEMLKGYNRVTIDSGSIEVGYISKIS